MEQINIIRVEVKTIFSVDFCIFKLESVVVIGSFKKIQKGLDIWDWINEFCRLQ
jgi:hypothetical protein